MELLNICLIKIKGFKFYIVLNFFKRKLELFALHFVRPYPHESLIYYYDFVEQKSD